jgi:hypothetical protein
MNWEVLCDPIIESLLKTTGRNSFDLRACKKECYKCYSTESQLTRYTGASDTALWQCIVDCHGMHQPDTNIANRLDAGEDQMLADETLMDDSEEMLVDRTAVDDSEDQMPLDKSVFGANDSSQ